MILTSHAITGAAIANMMPNHPALGFVAGFASHFVLDAIPHWDYKLRSRKKDEKNPLNNEITFNKDFFKDFIQMASDAILGLIVSLLIFGSSDLKITFAIILGVIGAQLPDALQFVFYKWKHEPMTTLQKFHVIIIHSKIHLDDRPILGISTQILLIATIAAISKLFF